VYQLGINLENEKDRIVGKLKETTGNFMDDEELEFKGKLQSMKADIGNKAENIKDTVLEKANDVIDKIKK
jgi:uncharacterized protein YjbJ (UPF0337 family)